MENEQLKAFATTAKKGRIHTFYYHKSVALAQKYVDMGYASLETRSRFQAMLGDYDNRKSVIAKRENGQVSGKCPLTKLIQDVLYENAQGELMLRVLPVNSGNARKVYILNGEEVTKEVIASIFPKSYYESNGCPECMHLKAANIERIA